MGTVCFLKGAGQIAQAIQKEFNLVPGGTSPDGKFTFSPVNCVGACALAPVMVVDGQYHGSLVVDSAVELLHKIAAAGSAEETPVERGVDGTSPKSPAVATPGLGGAKTAKKKARGGKKA
jgi:(2Fe-2S) ferredoxin